MSDESNESNDSKNPLLSGIGNVFLILVPLALIVMLGVVGLAFLGGGGVKESEKVTPEVAVSPPAAPAEGAAPVAATPAEGAAPPAPAAGGNGDIDSAVLALGKATYATCAACHGPDGKGLQAGPLLMAPSLVGSELLLGDPDASLLIVLKGIAKENMDYMGMMAPLAAGLDDEKLAAVLTYTRNEWGNSAPAVTKEQAAAARAKYGDINAPAGVKRAEILSLVEAHK